MEFREETEGKGREMEGLDKVVIEAVEYSGSEQVGGWGGTEGARAWVREEILSGISKDGMGWMEKAETIIKESDKEGGGEEGGEGGEREDREIDVEMFKGMFRTGIEMVAESGVFDEDNVVEGVEEKREDNDRIN